MNMIRRGGSLSPFPHRNPARADRVKGRKMATVAKCKFDLEVCGGTYVDEPCVIDGNLVSGRTFHDNGHYEEPARRNPGFRKPQSLGPTDDSP